MALRINTPGFRKFVCLLYKGLLLRKRHYIIFVLFEVLFPIIFTCIPAIIKSQTYVNTFKSSETIQWVPAMYYKPFNPLDTKLHGSEVVFAYAPANKHTKKLMENSITLFRSYQPKALTVVNQSFQDADDLERFCMKALKSGSYRSTYVFGTLFNNMPQNASKLPDGLDYTIRYREAYRAPEFNTDKKYLFSEEHNNEYEKTSFLTWQAAVERTFIEEKFSEEGKHFPDYQVLMQKFPYDKYKENIYFDYVSALLPSMMTYGFMFFIIDLIRRVIEEKSNGSKELLKMMGVTNFIYWSSTFMNYFSVGGLMMLFIAILHKVPLNYFVPALEATDFLLLLIIFLLFMANLILFCLAFTPFFSKAVFGIIVLVTVYNVCTALLLSLMFIPGMPTQSYYSLPLIAKLCICLFPPGALMSALNLVFKFESSGEGVRWSNLYSFENVPDMNMSRVLLSMIFSCFFYSFIIWCTDVLQLWQYRLPRPFYILFTKSYWCVGEEEISEGILLENNELQNPEFFEDEPTDISPSVEIKKLSKIFRSGVQKKAAVTNLSLNIYNHQITALLGHNGAGKTTTINILTGLYTPSGGSASINGWNVFSQTANARESVGVCPQHNVLYDTLTVEDHLNLYAVIKGVSWSKLNEETQSVMNVLNLTSKASELSKNLSGGLKRRLSLGIAIIGGSKVLFLDEPTSGLDVEARRAVWDVLLEIKHGRTIILTTHYMEEADVLSDRIAILAEGEIQCCGSPMFLKRKFGTGYHMHIVKGINFDINTFGDHVFKHVPDATVENDYEKEVTFNLRSNTNIPLAPLFDEIENNKERLGVNSCGITFTTMEDVFFNVRNISDMKLQKQANFMVADADETELRDIYMQTSQATKDRSQRNQFYGLIVKRLHYSRRHWNILFSLLILPFVILCFCFITIDFMSTKSVFTYQPLKLDIKEVYGQTDGFYTWDSETAIFAGKLKEVLQSEGVNVMKVSNISDSILEYADSSLINFFKRLIVSGSIEKTGKNLILTAWFNGAPYHAAPMSLLLMNSGILRFNIRKSYITLTNYPLPYTRGYGPSPHADGMINNMMANLFVPVAFSFMASSFVLVPIKEKASKAKLLQLMTGISAALYWTAMFVWDFFVSITMCILLTIPFAIFHHHVFFAFNSEAIGAALCLMILFAWAAIPFSYLFSLIFLKPNTGFGVVTFISIFTGVVISAIFTPLRFVIARSKVGLFFLWFFKLFPSYALSSGFGNLFSIAYGNAFCESLSAKDLKFGCDAQDWRHTSISKCCKDICGKDCMNKIHPFTFDEERGILWDALLLVVDGVLYFIILLILESNSMSSVRRRISQISARIRASVNTEFVDYTNTFMEDSGVLHEEERIGSFGSHVASDDALVVQNLSKKFKRLKAVDRLTFGVHKKECFGLLGVNGAGKTTTFRMLTGDCYPTEGNAHIDQISVLTHLKEFQFHIGYCPQFDALIDKLSGREMLTLFARLRGLTGLDLERTVEALIKMTDLHRYADKPSGVYSGGNKRKLSVALALIGSPPLILLDEPTAGVDPVSRRKIWKILSLARAYSDTAVILTTHSMEECEALCNRLAIMVNGRFRCLGSIQHLKTKFGQGFTLIIKVKKEDQSMPESMNAIKVYIDTNLKETELKDEHQDMLQYHISDPSTTLSYLFKFMDDMKMKFNLEDYMISDTSLEQIFLTFARSQRAVDAN